MEQWEEIFFPPGNFFLYLVTFFPVVAREMLPDLALNNPLQTVCLSPVKLGMQSVAVKGSNQRYIATRLCLSVYEIVTRLLMNFFFFCLSLF